MKANSVDKAGNESTPALDSFIFDATNPTVTLDSTLDFVKSLISISGTAVDTPPGQVDKVQLQIKNSTDSTYWNGSSWVAAESWLDATGTSFWSCSMPSLSNGKSYAVKAKAADKAGNESPIASDSFTFHSHTPPAFLGLGCYWGSWCFGDRHRTYHAKTPPGETMNQSSTPNP